MKKVRTLIVSASVASLLLVSMASVVEANRKICPRIYPNVCDGRVIISDPKPFIYPVFPQD